MRCDAKKNSDEMRTTTTTTKSDPSINFIRKGRTNAQSEQEHYDNSLKTHKRHYLNMARTHIIRTHTRAFGLVSNTGTNEQMGMRKT